jgi:hypothetical protein
VEEEQADLQAEVAVVLDIPPVVVGHPLAVEVGVAVGVEQVETSNL